MRALTRLMILVVLSAVPAFEVAADGKFFGRYSVESDPSIASQRGIVVWRDGVQTLVVESSVNAGGESIGWVLPIPAAPTSIAKTTPGTVETLQAVLRPATKTPRAFRWWLLVAIAFFTAMLWISLEVTLGRAIHLVRRVLAIAFVGLLVTCFFLLPAIGLARGGGAAEGVSFLQSPTRFGEYEVSVINADSVEPLTAWLDERSFSVPNEATSVLQAYIEDGWCFLVAELATDTSETMNHHPLKVSFPIESPVYPIRLTGVTDDPLDLDLFVIANRTAEHPDLACWWTGRFASDELHSAFPVDADVAGFRSPVPRAVVSHPSLAPLLFDGCVVTRLRGTLNPGAMREDLALSFTRYEPHVITIYSPRAAGLRGMAIVLGLLGVALPFIAARSHRTDRPMRSFIRTGAVIGILLASVTAIWLWSAGTIKPLLEDEPFIQQLLRSRNLAYSAERFARRRASDEDADLRQYLIENGTFTADELENARDVPGSAIIEETGSGWQVLAVDPYGIAVTMTVGRDGSFGIEPAMTPSPGSDNE